MGKVLVVMMILINEIHTQLLFTDVHKLLSRLHFSANASFAVWLIFARFKWLKGNIICEFSLFYHMECVIHSLVSLANISPVKEVVIVDHTTPKITLA